MRNSYNSLKQNQTNLNLKQTKGSSHQNELKNICLLKVMIMKTVNMINKKFILSSIVEQCTLNDKYFVQLVC